MLFLSPKQQEARSRWWLLRFDSCSQFHNLTRWALLLNATGRKVLIENCHQGGYAPGEKQWQAYVREPNSTNFTDVTYASLLKAGLTYKVVMDDKRSNALQRLTDEEKMEKDTAGEGTLGCCALV